MRETIKKVVNENVSEVMEVVNFMYENPEIGNEEFKAMDVLCTLLENKGFDVTRSYLVETGFRGVYDSGKEGRTVGFMCEYDALPEVGHGCGHNLIAGIGVLSAIALKSLVDIIGGKVVVLGTPAEENFGGKVIMGKKGAFDELSVALMLHPSTKNELGGRCSALIPRKFEFHGKSAHASHPQVGISALDAAVLTYTSISMMRQFMEPTSFIHGIIKHGGGAANVIPDYSSMEYYFRANTTKEALAMAERAEKAAIHAAESVGCTVTVSEYECPYGDVKINYSLCDLLKEKYEALQLSDIGGVDEVSRGSSDVGDVSYICPTLHGYIKIAEDDVAGHSIEMAAATISSCGRQALIDGSCALADIGADIIELNEIYAMVLEEFKQQ